MENSVRLIVIVVFVAIVTSLGSALYHLSRGSTASSARLARALTVRIGLSVALFILLMLAWHFGLIAPHGLAAGVSPR